MYVYAIKSGVEKVEHVDLRLIMKDKLGKKTIFCNGELCSSVTVDKRYDLGGYIGGKDAEKMICNWVNNQIKELENLNFIVEIEYIRIFDKSGNCFDAFTNGWLDCPQLY